MSPSIITLLVIGVFFIIYSEINSKGQKRPMDVIKSDAMFYHEYIAVHVFGAEPYIPREKSPVITYTMGMAITYIPGIAGGYLLTELKGADHQFGTNYWYKRILYYMGFMYCMIGLLFLRKILQRFSKDIIIAIVLALLFFGTNLYYYVKVEPLMAHAPSFVFITAFIYYSLKLFDKRTIGTIVKMGLFLGILTLIRPSNIIVVIFPLIYLLAQKLSRKEKIDIIKIKFYQWFILAGLVVVAFIPQMVYWHHYTGQWLYYSYTDQHFFWSKPAVLQFLFSFRKGWLIYTPVMLFLIPGAMICYKKNRPMFWSIILFLTLNIYVLSSWWCWWYGGSFGMRSMIDSYGLLAIWLAMFFQYILDRSKILLSVTVLLMGFLVYVNLHQTRLARINVIHFDSMTFNAYKEIFLSENNRNKYNGEQWDAKLDHPDYDKAKTGERFW